ncbi:MAG: alpha/beta hydrolase [Chloroflexi bacterium]|nr:alpha/beta hydrolase [Chloroflexota bacterium]
MSLIYLGETKTLNAVTRTQLPGDFIQLRDGVTHFELRGPKDADTVVLVHGFSVPAYIWDPTIEALSGAGLRVLRYDLFGRGTSDRPNIDYGPDLFDCQLSDLLKALCIEKPVDLIGLSMGGPIVTTFCDRHPERVRKLLLIDPVGAKPMTISPLQKYFKLLGVGELLLGWFGNKILLKDMSQDFYKPKNLVKFLARYKDQMAYRGFKRALLSTLRAGMLGDFSSTYWRVGNQDRPKLLIWGRDDPTLSVAHSQLILDAMPKTVLHIIENAGHIPHYEKPEIVNPLLISFLQ